MSTNSNESPPVRRTTRLALVWIAVLLIFSAAIALNFVPIKSFWNTGASVLRMRSAVQAEFGVQDVSINLNRGARILTVELADPHFAELTNPELEAKAKEVATLAFLEFGAIRGFERITVVVLNESDSVITISEAQEFHFTAAELAAEDEAHHEKQE